MLILYGSWPSTTLLVAYGLGTAVLYNISNDINYILK